MITLEPPRGFAADAVSWKALGLSHTGLSRFLRRARLAVGLPGQVDVLLAPDRRLRQLNRQFRNKDKATDVLSFPAPQELAETHAGDLAISYETAACQAAEHGHKLGVEIHILLLHGLLHLAGMDHEADSGQMAAQEADLREQLRLPQGLIARVQAAGQQPAPKTTKQRVRKAA